MSSASTARPRATSTAAPGGIGVRPPRRTSTTGAESWAPGTVGGSGVSVASRVPRAAGVAGPHACVYSAVPFAAGRSLSAPIGWLPASPRQEPDVWTRSTCSVPSASIPRLDRPGCDWWSSTPFLTRMPVG